MTTKSRANDNKMQWQDKAIVIKKDRYGEKNVILTVITENNGLQKGMIRGQKNTIQPSDFLYVTWRARNKNSLGTFRYEVLKSYTAFLLNNKELLLAINCLIATIGCTSLESESNTELFSLLTKVLNTCELATEIDYQNNSILWKIHYVKLELLIVQNLGYPLQLHHCIVTNTTHDLEFISPKTGNAVSKSAGTPFEKKLLTMPRHLHMISNNIATNCMTIYNFAECIFVTDFFMRKHYFTAFNRLIPISRQIFIKYLKTETSSESNIHSS